MFRGRPGYGSAYGQRRQVQRIDPEASQAMLRQMAVRFFTCLSAEWKEKGGAQTTGGAFLSSSAALP